MSLFTVPAVSVNSTQCRHLCAQWGVKKVKWKWQAFPEKTQNSWSVSECADVFFFVFFYLCKWTWASPTSTYTGGGPSPPDETGVLSDAPLIEASHQLSRRPRWRAVSGDLRLALGKHTVTGDAPCPRQRWNSAQKTPSQSHKRRVCRERAECPQANRLRWWKSLLSSILGMS